MNDSLSLLDEALEIGRKELGFLVAGDVEEAERLAQDRDRLTSEVLSRKHVSLDQVVEKLTQLQSLQGHITQEARRLHAALQEDLRRARQENRRFAGYAEGAGVVESRRNRSNLYVSKRG